MNKLLFSAGMVAVWVNVVFGETQGAELAMFGVGLMFAISFIWISAWMEL